MVTISERDRAKNAFADPQPYLRNNPYVDLRAEAVRRLLPRREGLSIIDLGCGDGLISIPLATDSCDLLLVDSSAGMLDRARSNVPTGAMNRVRYECVDLADFESRQKFDIVLCIGVLAHVRNPAATLRQIADLVGPHGCAVVQLTDDSYCLGRLTHKVGELRRRLSDAPSHTLNHMTLQSVCSELQSTGLHLLNSYRYVFVPGLRHLPSPMTRAVVRAVNGSSLSQRGGEVLALFTRT